MIPDIISTSRGLDQDFAKQNTVSRWLDCSSDPPSTHKSVLTI